MSRAVVVFSGRGAYGPTSLGSLPAGHSWVRRADELRAAAGRTPLSALDSAERFEASVHLRPTNAWPLILLCGLLDAERIADDHEVVAAAAVSTGWFTALVASGSLGFDDAFRVVEELATAAEEPLDGGVAPAELIYQLSDDAWRPDEARVQRLAEVLAGSADAFLGVDLGAFSIVAGTARAVDAVAAALDPVEAGRHRYPMRLAAPDAWHTPLRRPAIEAAVDRIGPVRWERPSVTLIDGRGYRFTPWSTDSADLARVTLHEQGATTYDVAAGIGVALRDYAPDVLLLAGPGGTVGTAAAQLVVLEGYRGLRTRADLEATQSGSSPLILSLRR